MVIAELTLPFFSQQLVVGVYWFSVPYWFGRLIANLWSSSFSRIYRKIKIPSSAW